MEWSLVIILAALALVVYFLGDTILEVILLVRIAMGGSRCFRTRKGSSRLQMHVVKTALLDEVSLREIQELCKFAMDIDIPDGEDPNDYILQQVQDTLLTYKYATLCRDRVDGSLRGMLLLDELERTHQGQNIIQMKMGLAFFRDGYRGSSLGYLFFLFRVLRHLILNFGKPIYVLVKVFSFKSYCIAVMNTKESYPRYDAETPAFEKSLMDEYGFSQNSRSRSYDAQSGIVKQAHVKLEEHQAPLSEEVLRNPHIAHFAKINPGWRNGDCLVTIVKMTLASFVSSALRVIPRMVFKGGRNRRDKPTLKRKASVGDILKSNRGQDVRDGDELHDNQNFITTSFSEPPGSFASWLG